MRPRVSTTQTGAGGGFTAGGGFSAAGACARPSGPQNSMIAARASRQRVPAAPAFHFQVRLLKASPLSCWWYGEPNRLIPGRLGADEHVHGIGEGGHPDGHL